MLRRSLALACLLTFSLSGCHSYRLADQAEAVAGTDVRMRITAEQSGRLMDAVRVQNRQIEGTVVEASTDNGMMLETAVLNSNPRIYQRISIPQEEIVDLEIKEFDRGRTVLMLGALAAAALGVGFAAVASDKNETEGDRNPEIDQIRIPLFSFGTR